MQVDLAAMEEDTGLQYGSCNELLYRPFRHMHVAAFKHTCLSQPTELLSISAKEVLQQGTQVGSSGYERASSIGSRVCVLPVQVQTPTARIWILWSWM